MAPKNNFKQKEKEVDSSKAGEKVGHEQFERYLKTNLISKVSTNHGRICEIRIEWPVVSYIFTIYASFDLPYSPVTQ